MERAEADITSSRVGSGANPIHILCPHCQNAIELVKLTAEEILCPSCGSTVRIADESTATYTPGSRTLGRFTLIENVGMGAFGTVFKAHDPSLDRIVAIKIPRTVNLVGGEDRERFLREARSVAQLNHPAIVPVHEVGEHEGTAYLVSEFVCGTTLSDFLTGRRLTVREAALLVAEIADALDYAHRRGVIHRDVKPSNVMLDADGKPHVMDFGLAKRNAGEVTMTVDGQVLGTPAYMAPEQARGESHVVDGRCDVYSLGVILYLLLTGELPFRGNVRMLIHQVLHDEPKPPRKLDDRIPRDLETIALKCLEKDPTRRYARALDLADDLRRYQEGESISARRATAVERTAKWVRRNRVVAGLTSAIVLVVLSGLIGTSLSLMMALAARNDALKREREANSLAGRMSLGRGLEVAERRGAPDEALLWFAQAGRVAPPDDRDLHRTIRANYSAALSEIAGLPSLERAGERWIFPDAERRWPWVLDGDPEIATVAPSTLGIREERPLALSRKVHRSASKVGRSLWLWDTLTGRLVRELTLDTGLQGLVFSEDGRVLFAYGGTVLRAWDAAGGEPAGPPIAQANEVVTIRPSRDGSRVLVALADRSLRLWDSRAGSPLGPSIRPGREGIPIAVHPTRETFLTAFERAARLWDAREGKVIGGPLTHAGKVLGGAFSRDGQWLVTIADEAETPDDLNPKTGYVVRSWNASNGEPVDRLKLRSGYEFMITPGSLSLTISADGRSIALVGRSGDKTTFGLGHDGKIDVPESSPDMPSALSPDGAALITSKFDGGRTKFHVVSTSGGTAIDRDFETVGKVQGIACGPRGTVVAALRRHELLVWDVRTGPSPRVWAFREKMRDKHGVELDENEEEFHKLISLLTFAIEISPDANLLATLYDRTFNLWRISDGSPVGRPWDLKPVVNSSVGFSPDSQTVVLQMGRTVTLIGSASGTLIGTPIELDHECVGAAFTPDGQSLIIGETDGTLRRWDAKTRAPKGILLRTDQLLKSFAVSPDGLLLATLGSNDAHDVTIQFWHASDQARIGQPFEASGVHYADFPRLVFSPDGRSLFMQKKDQVPIRYPAPRPIAGDIQRLELWAQVLSGRELSDRGDIRDLKARDWSERRGRLDALGGPPSLP